MSESMVWNAGIKAASLQPNTFTRGILWMTLSSISIPEIACCPPRGCLVMWKYNNIKVAVTRFAHTFLHTPMQWLSSSSQQFMSQVVLICAQSISSKMYSVQFATWVVSVPGVWEHDGCHSEEGSLWCHEGRPLLSPMLTCVWISHFSLTGLPRSGH